MPYTVEINPPVEIGRKIILPISMSQGLQQGERLKSILDELEKKGHKENVTVLVCDYLNRHNYDEQMSLTQGENFIAQHNDMLKGFKIIRWKEFIEQRKEKFEEQLKKIEGKSQVENEFVNKMQKTHRKCKSAQTLENSLKYQKEEYAAILCMDEFDELIYPKRITDGMSYLYGNIEGRKPSYNYIKITEKKLSEEQRNLLLFKPYNIDTSNAKNNHMHLALRMLLENAEKLLYSKEISNSSKQLFADAMRNLIDVAIVEMEESQQKNITSLPFNICENKLEVNL